MRRFGRQSIKSIIDRACKEFLENDSAPDFTSFFYKGHYVEAFFEWSTLRCCWYLEHFDIVYSRCVMRYEVGVDYDLCSAWCF